jgi:hypothetical protein
MKTLLCSCGATIKVDDDAPSFVFYYKWNCIGGSAVKSGSDILSHYIVPAVPSGFVRDHINRDIHDNQKQNLRIVTYSTSNLNRKVSKRSSTGLRGVSFDYRSGKYRALICIDNKRKYLGQFNTAEEANARYEKYLENTTAKTCSLI